MKDVTVDVCFVSANTHPTWAPHKNFNKDKLSILCTGKEPKLDTWYHT